MKAKLFFTFIITIGLIFCACCNLNENQTSTCDITQNIQDQQYNVDYSYDNPINYLNVSSVEELYQVYSVIQNVAEETYNEYEKAKKIWLKSKGKPNYFEATKEFLLKTINLTIKRQKLLMQILHGYTNNISYNETVNETYYYNEPYSYEEEKMDGTEYLRQAYEFVKNSNSIEEIRKSYNELKELIDQTNTYFTMFSYSILINIYYEVANKYGLSDIQKELDDLSMRINTGQIDVYTAYQNLEQIRTEIIKRGILNGQ